MTELSLHILDICQNSVKANASIIEISIVEQNNIMTITIKDDGDGMDKKTLEKVMDPFFTTRTTRSVGLGISLFKMASELTGGTLEIESKINVGTILKATFTINHIDLAPLGAIEDTIFTLLLQDVDLIFTYVVDQKKYIFSTLEIKEVIPDVSYNDPLIINWVKDNIINGIKGVVK